MAWYRCPVCYGSAYDDPEDEGWVKCMMCGRSYPSPSTREQLGAVKKNGSKKEN